VSNISDSPMRFSMDNADNKGLPSGGVAALR
jgi:hypothetical protein